MRKTFLALIMSALVLASPVSASQQGLLQVRPSKVNFGKVAVGSSAQLTVTVTNNTSTTISFVEWVNYEAGPFSLVSAESSCLVLLLAPSDTCTFTTNFSPTAAGRFTKKLDMSFREPLLHYFGAYWTVSGTGY